MLTNLGEREFIQATRISISDSDNELVAIKRWSLCDCRELNRKKAEVIWGGNKSSALQSVHQVHPPKHENGVGVRRGERAGEGYRLN